MQVACQPYIFLFIARPETILAANGRAFTYVSPALRAVLDATLQDLESEVHTMTRDYAQSQRLTAHDIMILNTQHVHHTENEHAKELAAEKAKNAEAEAEVAQLQCLLNTHSSTN